MTHRPIPWLRSARTWIAVGVLAPIGMLVLSGMMLLDLRKEAYGRAKQTSGNLLQVIERDIARNVELFDRSLRTMVEILHDPEIARVSPDLRQLVLFNRAATMRDMSAMLVLDEHGDIVLDEGALPPRKGNYADREYFRVQKARDDGGLHIGRPIVSRLTGDRVLPFSRRISKPDGSFGGVAFSSLKLTYFGALFDRRGLGHEGAINLYLRDGTRVMRQPFADNDIGANIAGAATFKTILSAHSGSFIGVSPRDGIERHYAFTQVGDLPLMLDVGVSTQEIEAEWRSKALVVCSIVLVLCGLTIGLSCLFGRELHRRAAAQAELAHLSRTDGLTGLANRRRFDQAFEQIWGEARRSGEPVSLLIVDADHFKRYNDRYGHAVGDAVLAGLARCLEAGAARPDAIVARIGGEEFAILLPGTDRDSALDVAAGIHRAVSALGIVAAGIDAGTVTVSIGLAVGRGGSETATEDLYRRADGALYEAKTGGRNRTSCAATNLATAASVRAQAEGRSTGGGDAMPRRMAGR